MIKKITYDEAYSIKPLYLAICSFCEKWMNNKLFNVYLYNVDTNRIHPFCNETCTNCWLLTTDKEGIFFKNPE